MATNDKIKMLLDTIARLSKLIQKENELLLKPGNKEELKQLLEEKKALTAHYEIHMQGFEIDNVKKNADPSMLKRLTETIEGFQTLTEENCNRLLAKVEATKRVFTVIQEVVRDNGVATKTYGNSGSVKNSIRHAFTPVLSVGVNDEI
ncbi:MAG TPA: hypothetical protein EYM28_03395 [Rhodospirillales bacterium]|nr:hypothetical protein [Rhodospirillales bacterium]